MPGLSFNHAMVYSRNVDAAVCFYADLLKFKRLEVFKYGDRMVYARLKSPHGNTTMALHLLEPGQELHPGAVRLYFEVSELRELKQLCKRLEKAGVTLTKQPQKMQWGWTHAYLDDPDGHEVSLYWAGEKRLRQSK
jgi:uncharacterized glyoxalase superfamily protein PhnB